VEVMQFHVLGFVECPGLPGGHEVAGQLGLAIDHDVPADQGLEVNAVRVTVEAEFNPVMYQAFRMHALAGLGAVHEVHAALFEHARADAAEYVFGALALENDGVDARQFQQTPQHQSRRTSSYNHNLTAQCSPPPLPLACAYRLSGEWTGGAISCTIRT